MASNLEDLGNTKGAIEFYRQLVILFPHSTPSVTARKRIKSLGGKVPLPSEYKPDSQKDESTSTPAFAPLTCNRKRKQYVSAHGYDSAMGYGATNAYGTRTVFVPSYFQQNGASDTGGFYGGMSNYGGRDVFVHGYFRQNGTYVNSYWRSPPSR